MLRETKELLLSQPRTVLQNPTYDQDLEEFRIAPGGEGKHAADWKDKPYRLIYDLVDVVQKQRQDLEKLKKQFNETVCVLHGCRNQLRHEQDVNEELEARLQKIVQVVEGNF